FFERGERDHRRIHVGRLGIVDPLHPSVQAHKFQAVWKPGINPKTFLHFHGGYTQKPRQHGRRHGVFHVVRDSKGSDRKTIAVPKWKGETLSAPHGNALEGSVLLGGPSPRVFHGKAVFVRRGTRPRPRFQ